MKVGIVGYGSMGSAMARIIREHHEVLVYTRTPEKVKEMKVAASFEEVGGECEAIVLAVKPKDLEVVAEELDPAMKKGSLLLSILGGTPLSRLQGVFSNPISFRLMPNLPLLCGKGLIGAALEDPQENRKEVEEILKGMGKVVWLEEKLMNPFAALTGSSPAFLCLVLEAMIQAGVTMGFSNEKAQEYVLDMAEGTAVLLKQTGVDPSEIREAVTSPGGTTIAGLNEMERLNVRHGVTGGILAALEKGKVMEE